MRYTITVGRIGSDQHAVVAWDNRYKVVVCGEYIPDGEPVELGCYLADVATLEDARNIAQARRLVAKYRREEAGNFSPDGLKYIGG